MKQKHNTIQFTKALTLPALIIVSALPVAFGQLATTSTWNGSISNDWNTAGNWTPSGIPGTGIAAGISNSNSVTTSANAAPDLAQVVVNGGSTLNLSHTLGINGSGGGLYVGGIDGAGNGTVNVGAGGSLLVSGAIIRIGRNTTSAMTLADGGVITTDSEITIGEWYGSGSLTQTGGTLTHTGGDFRVGSFGGTGGTGVWNISGGTANIANLRLNYAGAGTGTITQSGTSVVNYSGDFGIGWANSGNATYNMQGGTLTSTGRMRFGIGNAVHQPVQPDRRRGVRQRPHRHRGTGRPNQHLSDLRGVGHPHGRRQADPGGRFQ